MNFYELIICQTFCANCLESVIDYHFYKAPRDSKRGCFYWLVVEPTHLKNIRSKWESSPNKGENKKYLKAPPSSILYVGYFSMYLPRVPSAMTRALKHGFVLPCIGACCVSGLNTNGPILLIDQLICSLSPFTRFRYPRWCRISSINRITPGVTKTRWRWNPMYFWGHLYPGPLNGADLELYRGKTG